MYGYSPPKRPELHDVRVMVCESEVQGFLERFPNLTRQQVLRVMIESGPDRQAVESALAGLEKVARPA